MLLASGHSSPPCARRLTALRAARIVYLQLGEVDHALRAWTAYIPTGTYGDTAGLRPCFGAGPEADRPRMATGPGGSRAVGEGSYYWGEGRKR